MFDLKQVQCFVAVGEELHFGRAAKRMNMTQPPLSRQIQLLEHELGIQLLLRTSRSVQLTAAGSLFLSEARRLLIAAQTAASSAQRVARGDVGLINLAFTAGASYSFLPKLLTGVNESLSGLEIVLHEMISEHQAEALCDSSIDVGLLRSPLDPEQFEIVCVARETLLLAVPIGHRLARARILTLADIDGEPFIMYCSKEGNYLFELIEGLFAVSGITKRYVLKLSQIHSILALVSAGHGIALVPESAKALHFDGAVLRKIRLPSISVELFLAWRKDNTNPALPAFRKLVLKNYVLGR
jgi:DNA-binding transcriptional LysR family regulator